jgi:putative spermidine/putrescine transport system substrate-binding protein
MAKSDLGSLLRALDRADRLGRRQFLRFMLAAGAGTLGVAGLAGCRAEEEMPTAPVAPATATAASAATTAATPVPTAAMTPAATPAAAPEIDVLSVAGYEPNPDKWKGRRIVITDFGGAMRDVWRTVAYQPFSQLTGAEIVEDSSDTGKLRAQVDSGNVEWSVSQIGTFQMLLLGRQGYLEEIDYSVVDKTDFLPGVAAQWGVAALYWSTILAYREETYGSNIPQGWKDFWDVERFPGARGLYKTVPVPNVEFALIADGVPKDQVYQVLRSEGGIDRAFASLDRIKPHITVWWDAGAQPPQLLADGELDMCSAWNGRIDAVQREGAKIGIQWNEGQITTDSFVIPKGAPNRDVAMDFINFVTRPEVQARMAMLIPYGPVNQRSFSALSPELVSRLPSSPELHQKQFERDLDFWLEHQEAVTERWNSWLLG